MILRLRGIGRAALLAPALATALLPGCGTNPTGGSGSTRSVIAEEGWALAPLEFVGVDIRLTGVGNGTLDATVEWTFASDNIDVYVTASACTVEMFENGRCGHKAKADSGTAKPERISFGVSAGDSYRFWVVNLGPQRESGTLVVGLTQNP